MNHTARFFEGITEGAAIAGATFGHSTLIGCVAGGALSLTGAFLAASTGHNVVDVAQKCGYAAFLAGVVLWRHGTPYTSSKISGITINSLPPNEAAAIVVYLIRQSPSERSQH